VPSIIAGKRCSSRGKGDGLWDPAVRHWVAFPCCLKCCARHWRRYAKRKYRSLKDSLVDFPYWFHVRLSCKRFLRPGERFQALTKFRAKLHAYCGDVLIVSIAHRNRVGVHFHLIVGSTLPIAADDVNRSWKAHFPAKATHRPYRRHFTMTKPHDNPRRLLWYSLLGRKRSPREAAPWLGIPLRSPVSVYCKRGSVGPDAAGAPRC
jgi:hypothetical protein